jgi:hypothetical protein
MLIAIDTGLTTTKVATLSPDGITVAAFASTVVRGLVGEQGAGVYCTGRSQAAFQFYSVLSQECGLFPLSARGFRDPTSARRRVLVEHAMSVAKAAGKTALVFTQPVANYYRDGIDHHEAIEHDERTMMKMPVTTVDALSGRTVRATWAIKELAVSPESVWSIYDLAINDPSTARDDLAAFDHPQLGADAVIAIADFGATGTRVNFIEWSGDPVPTLLASRSREVSIGGAHVADELERRLIEAHGYRDVIDLVAMRSDPTVMIAGKRVDISAEIEASEKAVFEKLRVAEFEGLAAEVERGDVQAIMLVGGASHLFGAMAKELFPADRLLETPDPIYSPVRGLLKSRAALKNGGGR